MNPISKYIKPLFLILILSTLNACRDCKEKGNCPLIEYQNDLGLARDYLLAKDSSFWIYKHSVSGDLDTITLINSAYKYISQKGSLPSTKHITLIYDYLERTLYSSYNQSTYTEQTSQYNPDVSVVPKSELIRTSNNTQSGGKNLPFFYPFTIGSTKTFENAITTCNFKDSNHIVAGKNYRPVATFDIDINGISNPKNNCLKPHTKYYWSPDIGLIKIEHISCGYSWDLIKYVLK